MSAVLGGGFSSKKTKAKRNEDILKQKQGIDIANQIQALLGASGRFEGGAGQVSLPGGGINVDLPKRAPGLDFSGLEELFSGLSLKDLTVGQGGGPSDFSSPGKDFSGGFALSDDELFELINNPNFAPQNDAQQALVDQALSGSTARFNRLGIATSPGAQGQIAASAAPVLEDIRQNNIRALLASRGQDITKGLGLTGLDLEQALGIGQQELAGRGQDIGRELGLGEFEVAARGQDLGLQELLGQGALGQAGLEVQERGQDIEQRAQEIGRALGLRGQDLDTLLALLQKASPIFAGGRTTGFNVGGKVEFGGGSGGEGGIAALLGG